MTEKKILQAAVIDYTNKGALKLLVVVWPVKL